MLTKRLAVALVALGLVAGDWTGSQDLPAVPTGSLPAADGSSKALDAWKGKVVLLDFWATWCGPCRQSLPRYAALAEELGGKGFAVVAVSVDERDADVDRYLAKGGLEARRHEGGGPLPFTVLRDPKGEWAAAMRLTGMPTSFLIDRSGKIRERHDGFSAGDEAALRERVLQLLAEP